jgi:AcrR family transcriptional regulator
MYRSGRYTVAAIATTLGVNRASIYRHLPRTAADQAAGFTNEMRIGVVR